MLDLGIECRTLHYSKKLVGAVRPPAINLLDYLKANHLNGGSADQRVEILKEQPPLPLSDLLSYLAVIPLQQRGATQGQRLRPGRRDILGT